MTTIDDGPRTPAPYEPPPYRPEPQRKGLSGTLLFLVTLGVAVLLSLVCFLSLGALGGDNPETAFIVPAAALLVWFLFVIALLFFAGRAISDRNRPGEAGTAIVLALFLTPVVFTALPVAIGAQSAIGLASLFGGSENTMSEEIPFEDLEGIEDFEGEQATIDDYGSDPELDLLWDACEAGDNQACDDLYSQSPFGSGYEEFAEANRD